MQSKNMDAKLSDDLIIYKYLIYLYRYTRVYRNYVKSFDNKQKFSKSDLRRLYVLPKFDLKATEAFD